MKCPKDGSSMYFKSDLDRWFCPNCNEHFYIDIPYLRKHVEVYRGKNIGQYWNETGYRIDMGTMRSKEVPTVQEARALVDYSLSPRKHGEDYPLSSEFNQNDNDYDPLGG